MPDWLFVIIVVLLLGMALFALMLAVWRLLFGSLYPDCQCVMCGRKPPAGLPEEKH